MELTAADIAKYKQLYKERFGTNLDDHEARYQLSLLVRQVEIVYRPITEQQLEKYKEMQLCDVKASTKPARDPRQEKKA